MNQYHEFPCGHAVKIVTGVTYVYCNFCDFKEKMEKLAVDIENGKWKENNPLDFNKYVHKHESVEHIAELIRVQLRGR